MKRSLPGQILVRALLAGVAAAVAAGCYDSGFGEPEPGGEEGTVSESLAGVRQLYAGKPFVVEGEIVVAGTVTSSDRAGNFYRTLCIEEEQSAIEIMAGIDGLHNDYPPGCRVTLRLKGLTLAESRGVLQAGNAPEPGSGFETDYIGSRAALDRVLSRNSEALQPVTPAVCTIPALTIERCGTLVRIDHLRAVPDAAEEEDLLLWNGYRTFVDPAGNRICSYVRSYASFAGKEIPPGNVSLVGILQYDDSGEGRFLLKLRDENDCIRLD